MRYFIWTFCVLAFAKTAQAYPQFQLSRGQSCASCHVSPAGGGILNDMGEMIAEEHSSYGGNPAFFHGKVNFPEWLKLGGDVRAAGGVNANPNAHGAVFPMQAELYTRVAKKGFSATAFVGLAKPRSDAAYTAVQSREHYLMWKQKGGSEGVYVRAGRYIPVYGLRLAEHPVYTRRYGGTPLYGETYGGTFGILSRKAELHVTGFFHDPLTNPIERGDGAALYAEARVTEKIALGMQSRYAQSDDETRTAGGVTGKLWWPGADILFQAESQWIHQTFDAGPSRDQIVAYLMTSWFPKKSLMVDLGLGHYDEDVAVKALSRDAADLNVHWFVSSHTELLLTTRLQTIGFGDGGPNSGYALIQLHYRL